MGNHVTILSKTSGQYEVANTNDITTGGIDRTSNLDIKFLSPNEITQFIPTSTTEDDDEETAKRISESNYKAILKPAF